MRAIALLPALAVVAGAACGAAFDPSTALGAGPSTLLGAGGLPTWVLVFVVAGAAVAYLRQYDVAFVACAAAAFACGGWALAVDARQNALETPLRAALDREFGGFRIDTPGPGGRHDPIRVRGILTEDASRQDDVTTLRMRVTQARIRGSAHAVDGIVALSVAGTAPRAAGSASLAEAAERRRRDPATSWTAGRTVETMATLRRPARYLNEGVPDFERDLALSGTTLYGSVKSGLLVDVISRGSPVEEVAARVRQHVRLALERWIAPHDPLSSAIAAAVLIGDRSGLPDEVRLRLQAAGTYHIIAISGGNIAILAGLGFGVLYLVGITGRAAAMLTLLLLLAYAEIVTAGASVWRATLMATLYLLARVFDHRTPPWQAMGVAATLVVCANPLDVRDVGFILTFGATAALLEASAFAAPRLRRDRADPAYGPLRQWFLASIAASAAAEVILFPVSASAFSRVTVAGLVLNLVAVPLMSVLQIAATVVALMDRLDLVASLAGWSAHLAAQGILWSARLVDIAPWLTTRVAPPPLMLVVVYYAALGTALLSRRRIRACSIGVLLAAAVAITSGVEPLHAALEPGYLRFTVFDVGQGDAELLELPDQSRLLVDTGGIPFGASAFDIGARVLAPALWARGVRSIDTLLLTHGDPDHIGGARAVIDDFQPAVVWQGIPVLRHTPMRQLLAHARSAGAAIEERTAGEQFTTGSVRIRVLHPSVADWERPRVRNDDSVVIEVVHGDVAFLLTGDIGADIERAILPQLTPARIRVLKVAHHGSRTSSSPELLETWRPQIAIISCGRGNSFGHPAPEVVQRLTAVGARIYRTDLDGQVTVDSDGSKVTVRTFVGKAS